MAKGIVWSERAQQELIEILKYWHNRNKSKTFSKKLNQLIREQLILVQKHPFIGRMTDLDGVFVKIIRDYLLFYELNEGEIIV